MGAYYPDSTVYLAKCKSVAMDLATRLLSLAADIVCVCVCGGGGGGGGVGHVGETRK